MSSNMAQEPDISHVQPSLNGEETGWRSWLSIPRDCFNSPWLTFLLIIIAWAACSYVRYTYIEWADVIDQFKWEGVVQPTTHDAFTHGAMIEQHVSEVHDDNPNMYPLFNSQGALHVISWAVLKTTSLDVAQLVLWAPVFLGSLMVVPLVLLGRVFGSSLWGFTAALLGGVAFNYYERSMAGYFDTDLFSFWVAMLLVYYLIAAYQKKSLLHACLGSIVLFMYPFFYAKGLVIGSAIAGCYLGIQLMRMLIRSDYEICLRLMIPVALAASISSWSHGVSINRSPWLWVTGLILIVISFFLVSNSRFNLKNLSITASIVFVWLMINLPWGYFIGQVQTYSNLLHSQTDTAIETDPLLIKKQEIEKQIDFRRTHKFTIKESQGEQWSILAQRITGSTTGTILAFIGFILLCLRYPAFLVGLPLAAIGIFAFDAGLRFTTWGGVIAAPALIYLLFIVMQAIFRLISNLDPKARRFGTIACGMLLSSPFIAVNYVHAISFKVAPVFNSDAILAMDAIRKASSPGDYVMSWWDYGSGIWYYSGCNVLMTPISASNDCWTMSEIFCSDSQTVAAGLSAMATSAASEGHRPAADHMLDVDGESPLMPAELIERISSGQVDIPSLDQDVFLYLPVEMLPLMGVLESFSNPEYTLPNSPKAGCYSFIPAGSSRMVGPSLIQIPSGLILNTSNLKTFARDPKGNLIPIQFKSVIYVDEKPDGNTTVATGPTMTDPPYRVMARGGSVNISLVEGNDTAPANHHHLHLVIMAKSGNMILMSDDHLNSNAIQMVALQQVDLSIWELIYKSGYARVFKLRKDWNSTKETSVDAIPSGS